MFNAIKAERKGNEAAHNTDTHTHTHEFKIKLFSHLFFVIRGGFSMLLCVCVCVDALVFTYGFYVQTGDFLFIQSDFLLMI